MADRFHETSFQQANDLPRSQQQKIAAVLEAFITQNRQAEKQMA